MRNWGQQKRFCIAFTGSSIGIPTMQIVFVAHFPNNSSLSDRGFEAITTWNNGSSNLVMYHRPRTKCHVIMLHPQLRVITICTVSTNSKQVSVVGPRKWWWVNYNIYHTTIPNQRNIKGKSLNITLKLHCFESPHMCKQTPRLPLLSHDNTWHHPVPMVVLDVAPPHSDERHDLASGPFSLVNDISFFG